MRYVIIGNSAAGVFAAEAIRTLDKAGRIDIIGEEPYPAYARCLTSYYLTGRMANEQLFIRPTDFYSRSNLNFHSGIKATNVDPNLRMVYTNKGVTFHYDRLLIATGASPTMPNIPGIKNDGVFGLRTLSDAQGILAHAGPGKRAVIVGGGFVSLKAAYALLKAGLSVTCIISSGQILSQILDGDAASIMADALISKGLIIKYHNDVTEVLSKDNTGKRPVSAVRLANGEELPADVVIIGKGVTPNTGFLDSSKIEIDSGIVVNQFLQTNFPDIYAAGDVAQTYDIILRASKVNAIWPNATEQGTVAGCNMAGAFIFYAGSIGMNSADFYGLSTIAAGKTKAEGVGYEVVKLYPGKNLYRRLVFKDDVLVGYIIVGNTAKAGLLTTLVKEQVTLGAAKQEVIRGRFRQKILW